MKAILSFFTRMKEWLCSVRTRITLTQYSIYSNGQPDISGALKSMGYNYFFLPLFFCNNIFISRFPPSSELTLNYIGNTK